jgi:hypothetical protein
VLTTLPTEEAQEGLGRTARRGRDHEARRAIGGFKMKFSERKVRVERAQKKQAARYARLSEKRREALAAAQVARQLLVEREER